MAGLESLSSLSMFPWRALRTPQTPDSNLRGITRFVKFVSVTVQYLWSMEYWSFIAHHLVSYQIAFTIPKTDNDRPDLHMLPLARSLGALVLAALAGSLVVAMYHLLSVSRFLTVKVRELSVGASEV